MVATAITLAAILVLAFIGLATIAALKPRFTRDDALAAPAIGLCIVIIPAIWLTRAGLAGETFAVPLIAVLTALSIVVFALRRSSFAPLRVAAVPASVAAALVLFVVGFPQLHYGLGWLSFSNDDMTNYMLDSTRLIRYPEFAEPILSDLLTSVHPEQWTWFIFAKDGDRYGFDLFLAIFGVVAKRSTLEIYMPVILALHFCVTLAATALFAKNRSTAAVTFIAATIALAPANAAATYYQLGPQIAGLACLAAGFYFLSIARPPMRRELVTSIALGGAGFAGLLVTYPELAGVFGVSLFISSVRLLWPLQIANLRTAGATIGFWVIGGVAGIGYLGIAGVNAVLLLFSKTLEGAALGAGYLSAGFNSAVTPSGLVALFGLAPIDSFVHGTAGSLEVIGALMLSAVVIAWAVRSFLTRDASSAITSSLGILLILLIASRSGYGAFKTILYIQPFLFGTLADAALAFTLPGPRYLQRIPLAAYAVVFCAMLPTLYFYEMRSDDPLPMQMATYTLISNASATHLTADLNELAKQTENRTIVSDSNLEPLSKIESSVLQGSPMLFPSHDAYASLQSFRGLQLRRFLPRSQFTKLADDGTDILKHYYSSKRRPIRLFVDTSPGRIGRITFFFPLVPKVGADALFLYQGKNYTVFNRSNQHLPSVRSVGLVPFDKAKNAIVFVDSSLGASRNFGRFPTIFAPEPDYFFRGSTMSAVGRYLMLEILNPKHPRLEISLTHSLANSGNPALPARMTIFGAKSQSIRLGGSGSARIISEPIEPVTYQGHSYIIVDLHALPHVQPNPPEISLARLFNGDLIKEDTRSIVGFVRDISILDDAPASRLPIVISHFPSDLGPCCLEYSGLYEDGWLSRDSWYSLRSENVSDSLVVEGSVPAGIPSQPSRVVLDGRIVYRQTLVPGIFSFTIPLPRGLKAGRHRVEIHFGSARTLGSGDLRTASALLYSVGFHAN